ncbi:MAG: GGDEF domain-containing protein [Leptospiraceae bacterium]|nr:GGDEF domain-containing protein [Leptospiraceae bacterium]MCP5502249.1 GGDEF domain-containing protein [Leptospiraceae bacterium]
MDQEKIENIGHLERLLKTYEKASIKEMDELVSGEKIIHAFEKIDLVTREELLALLIQLQELREKENRVKNQILSILDKYSTEHEDLSIQIESLIQKNREDYFSEMFKLLCSLELSAEKAKAYWEEVIQHSKELSSKLGREVEIRVALMDHIIHKSKLIKNPKIIELNLYEDIIKNNITDELTGVFNRRYFNIMISREIKRSQRYSRPFSLLMLDVDDFKKFNDMYGHETGDIVLKLVGDALKSCFRSEDVVSRVGGEEFTVILPEVDGESALIPAKRFLKYLTDHASNQIGKKVTASGGIATYPIDGMSSDAIYSAADKAMYRSKLNGKNQITLSTV